MAGFMLGSATAYLKLNTTGWASGMRGANTSLQSLARTSMKIGAALIADIALITREYGKFDKSIRHATSVSELSQAQFEQMSKMALDASVKWNKAASDTAQAFYYLGSAGLTATEQMQAFNDTIMLSRAMGSELSMTVEGLVDIVRAFGLEFEDTSHIADILTKTVTSSNQHFEELDKAMSYAGATAAFTNNTLADTAAIMGVMANAGIKGSKAGTILRRSIANLISPTAEMSKLIYQMGLEIYDTTGKMRPMIEILADMNTKMRGTSEEYRNMVFKILFGLRAVGGQVALFNYTAEALREYSDEIKNAGGATERVASKQMKAMTEQLGRLYRQAQKFAIMIGEQLAPAIKRVADRLMEQAKSIEEYIKLNKEAIANTLKWVTVVGALAIAIPILASIASSLLSLINPFTIMIGVLYMFRTIWGDMFKKNGELAGALDEFTEVMETWLAEKFGVFGKIITMTVSGWGMILGKSAEGWGMIIDEFDKLLGLKPETPTEFGEVLEKGKVAAGAVGKGMMAQFKADMMDLLNLIEAKAPTGVQGAIDTLRELIDLIMKEPSIADIVEETTEATKDLNNTVGRTVEKFSAWEGALIQMFDKSINEIETWQAKFVTVLENIQSSWAMTFENMMDKGGNFKDFMEDIFNAVRLAFNRMIAEMAANDLLAALTGKEKGEGTPSLWRDIINPIIHGREINLPGTPTQDVGTELSPRGKFVPGGTTVNVINQTREPVTARNTGQYWNGKQWIVDVVLEAFDTDPNVRARLAGG